MVINDIDVGAYRRSVFKMFCSGGGKNANHMYVGEPNSGKTGLTKPLLKLFGSRCFLKPQVGTTFALQGLVGAKAAIWNDFRWPHPPLAWGDMLNILDNEPFNVGVPKVDGQTDVRWNEAGNENVMAVFTSNAPIVYITEKSVNPTETQAWNDRFGFIGHFKTPIANPDKRFKKWFQCTNCYSSWILQCEDAGPAPSSAAVLHPSKKGRTGNGPRSPDTAGSNMDFSVADPSQLPEVPCLPFKVESVTPDFDDEDDWEGLPQMQDQGEPQSSQTQVVLPAASAPNPSTEEPVRALNLFFSRVGAKPLFVETQTRESTWSCQVSGRGLSATGVGSSKKAAKREAALAFLQALAAKQD